MVETSRGLFNIPVADDERIIQLLSEAAQAEAERREIERERLSYTAEILAILQQRKDIERQYAEIVSLILAVLNEVAEEIVGQARETRETIALLLHVILDDKDDAVRDNLKTLVYQPASRLEEVQTLITLHQKVLEKYRQQQAKYGMHVPPFIEIEIENTERTITELQEKLRSL